MDDEAMQMFITYMQEEESNGYGGRGGRYSSFPSYDRYGGRYDDAESWGYYYLEKIYRQYQAMGIRSFNLSKYMAYQVLK